MSDAVRRIDSPTNSKVKAWRALHKRREREATGVCLVEGARELGRALAAGQDIESVLVAVDPAPSVQQLAAAAQRAGAAVFELGDAALAKVSLRRHPAPVIGVVGTPGRQLSDVTIGASPLVLVADGVEKPGNIGAMIRAADGAGADALIAADPVTDLGNPNVIRASQGAVFGFQAATGSGDEVAAWLEALGVTPLVAADEADQELWDADLTRPTAIIVGSEDKGVSPRWRQLATVSIPMRGMSDSLNASVAAAVILYEAARQRGARNS